MMADTVLSQLCSICHAEPHKYKCPGCGARTCSLPCTKKHKIRTECSGRHNPTDYVPREKLCTPAGIDHDYNFISAIDRAKQRAERDIVQELGLVKEHELHPKNEQHAFHKVWTGDQLQHVPVNPNEKHRDPRRPPVDNFDRQVRRRLRALDIDAQTMPKGMARQKENQTSYNRRTQCINWQVEWLLYGVPGFDQQQTPTRILHKVLDNRPLNKALATSVNWQHGQLNRLSREQAKEENGDLVQEDDEEPKKNKKSNTKKRWELSNPTQDPTTGTWPTSSFTLQYSLTGEWNQWSSSAAVPVTEDEKAADFSAKYQFYLHQVGKPVPGGRKALIPLPSTETLAEALSGRTVVEFPTIYVFPFSTPLPEGFVEGSAERREKRKQEGEQDSGDNEEGERRHPAKKMKQERREQGDKFSGEQRGKPERPGRFQRQERPPRQPRGQNNRWEGKPRGRLGVAEAASAGDMAMDVDAPVKTKEESEEGEILSDREPMEIFKEDRGRLEHRGKVFKEEEPGVTGQPKGLVDYDSSGSD